MITYEEAQGWTYRALRKRIKPRSHFAQIPEDTGAAIEVRSLEMKGRSIIGELPFEIMSANLQTVEKGFVAICGVQLSNESGSALGWETLIKIEHYHVDAEKILKEAGKVLQ